MPFDRAAPSSARWALKEARAIATRYEKLAIHYLALVQISMIRLLVRHLERPPVTPKPGS